MASSHKLATYRSKRDFTKTREPSGVEHRKQSHGYLIQKHAAHRLHYDFRIEMDGVLKSWAITRGPSLNPSDKRLAIHVEDHPLAYGSFEGTIPQGQYGGGTVMLWDQGSWEPIGDAERGYKKGNLTMELHGKRLKGRWHLVRMHGRSNKKPDKHENWLLIKGNDQYANENGEYVLEHFTKSAVSGRSMEQIAKGKKEWHSSAKPTVAVQPRAHKEGPEPKMAEKLPAFVAPQLATLADAPPVGENWTHEIKFDGYRLLARIEHGQVRLLTRANHDWTHKFASLAKTIGRLRIDNALLDGEVVHREKDGTMSFHGLQHALSTGDEKDIHYYLFDLLFENGADWRVRPLVERKQALKDILKKAPQGIHYSEDFAGPGKDMIHHACQIGLEGIISKRTDAPYQSGRGDLWLKSKCGKEQEVVIGGYTLQPKHPASLGALFTGFHKDGDFIFSGKVGTGFSQREGSTLIKKLRSLERSISPFVSVPSAIRRGAKWVEPKLVAQVHFTEWTPDGRMRHPSFGGLREDKPAAEVVKEQAKYIAKPEKKSSRMITRTGEQDCIVADVKITHPDKQLYLNGVTKRDLANYFEKVAPLMLPHVAGRPISLMRCPTGAGRQCFFQRHGSDTLSPHVKPVNIAGHGDGRPFLMIEDVQGLIGLVQMGVLEIHVWGSKALAPDKPDRLVFDLDPAPDVPFARVKAAAKKVHDNLQQVKLVSFLKSTGGKGLHVVVPFVPGPGWDEVKNFARAFAQTMTDASPEHFTINSRKNVRGGKIFIDYLRNDETASSIAPYSTRARDGAPIAAPLEWSELIKLQSGHEFTLGNSEKRLKKDPWKDMPKLRQKLML